VSGSPGYDEPAEATVVDANHEVPRRWVTHVVLACVAGIAAAGMVMGFYGTDSPPRQTTLNSVQVDRSPTGRQAPVAVAYARMADVDLGPNAQWKNTWPIPGSDPVPLYDEAPADPQARAAVISQRAQRRAFDGAPPVVPHAIDQQNASSCLVCHEEGLRVGEVVAPRMSHETYANCTQCHVESTNRALPPTGASHAPANGFSGLAAPGPGERAWPSAPPVIPHTTWMRENCTSCHGVLAPEGMRASHPLRENCVQCHAPSAELDQWRPAGGAIPPVAAPQEADP